MDENTNDVCYDFQVFISTSNSTSFSIKLLSAVQGENCEKKSIGLCDTGFCGVCY